MNRPQAVVEGWNPVNVKTLNCTGCKAQNVFYSSQSGVNVRCFACRFVIVTNPGSRPGSPKNTKPQADMPSPPPSKLSSETTLKETAFYDLLGVTPEATADEIKKGYYKAARSCHPDKHPDDPEAERRFKLVSDAYQVLSDPKLKERYDKYGQKGVEPDGGFQNARDFFSNLFGGGKFKDFIGEDLMIANAMGGESTGTPEENEAQMRKKVETLSIKLAERLNVFVKGDARGFVEDARVIVAELKGESYAPEILRTIGYIYDQEATKAGGGFFGFTAEFAGKAHTFGSTFSAISAAVRLQNTQKEAERADDSTKGLKEEQLMNEGKAAIWKIGKLEVEATLRQVCQKVLSDPTIDKKERQKRADALKQMAKIFSEVALNPKPE